MVEQGGTGGKISTVPPFPHEAILSGYRRNKGKFVVKGFSFFARQKSCKATLDNTKNKQDRAEGNIGIFLLIFPLIVLLRATNQKIQNFYPQKRKSP